jgi:transposase
LQSPLAGFARHLRRDRDAVAAALQLPWSNGMVEGQVHRLKLIKRQMYGRASFDLLRLRVLQSAKLDAFRRIRDGVRKLHQK